MAPNELNSSSWNNYEKMFLDDRVQNREDHAKLFQKLEQISNQLIEIRTEREQAKRWVSPVTAAVIAAAVTGLAKFLGL